MEVSGKIKLINGSRSYGEKRFRKRSLVLTTSDHYSQSLLIEFTQDKCDLLDNYKIGDKVTIAINLRGKEWLSPDGGTKYFNSINGWRIENSSKINPKNSSAAAPFEVSDDYEDFPDPFGPENTDEKLPF